MFTIDNGIDNGLCGPPTGGLVTIIIIGYNAATAGQPVEREIELFGDVFVFICGLCYPPNVDAALVMYVDIVII